MNVAEKLKRTLTGLKGHLTRQLRKCADLAKQTPIDYLELESYYQLADKKFEQIRAHIVQYIAELAKTKATDEELDDIMRDLAAYEDEVQVKLQPFLKLITQNKLTVTSNRLNQPEVKLPSLSLPTFSGTEDENWDDFWNKFTDAVDS